MASVIERSTYFTSLPREYYFSEEILEREIERIYNRQWLYYGHVSEIPEPGDYLARQLPGESVIAIRTAEGDIRAFANVCRHRGARLCPVGSGHASRNRITCPYHQWSFSSDGRLLNAPTIPEGDINYADWGLHPIQLEVWQGFIFVGLGNETLKPVAEEFGPDHEFARLDPYRMKIAHKTVDIIQCNWKAVFENFSECYHCPGTHPELCSVTDQKVFDSDVDTRWDEDPWKYRVLDYAKNLRPGMRSLTMDGEYVSKKLFGDLGEGTSVEDRFGPGFYIQPARTTGMFFPDYGHLIAFNPIGVDKTEFITWWFVHEDAVEGVDYDLDALTHVVDITNRQDVVLCELVQDGMRSRRYSPGPISMKRETGVRMALGLYLEMMGRE